MKRKKSSAKIFHTGTDVEMDFKVQSLNPLKVGVNLTRCNRFHVIVSRVAIEINKGKLRLARCIFTPIHSFLNICKPLPDIHTQQRRLPLENAIRT